jgi:beta-glucosidase-like glycosyl hydrolase/CubicO group peptidase (beta-lactamase class C family)
MHKNKSLLTTILLLSVAIASATQNSPTMLRNTDAEKMKLWVDSVFDTMTLDEKIGQMMMITVSPETIHKNKVLQYIDNQKIGGILFSKGNIDEESESINNYQKYSKIPLFIALDGEWGLAMRLENTPKFPKNMTLGAVENLDLIRMYGEEVGKECQTMGIHINFAPVVDVNVKPENPVIGNRSFGENPQAVAERAIEYAKGIESQNVISVAKHFPGHGDTSEDSHKTLPTVNKNRKTLDEIELYPFKQYIKNGFAGIMTAHLSVPNLDSVTGKPTSLSPIAINQILKNELGFNGLIFTDALAMKGAAKSQNICVDAIKAGNDVLLNPANPETEFSKIKKAVENGEIPIATIEEKCIKILSYKYVVGLNKKNQIERKNLAEKINTENAKWLVKKLNNEAVTLLKNTNSKIPIKNLKRIAVINLPNNAKTPFMETLALYCNVVAFNIPANATKTDVNKILLQLKDFDTIICTIHSAKHNDSPIIQKLAETKDVHLCFFTSPYSIIKFKQSIQLAKSVIIAYENTRDAQEAAAELIMGGIEAKGKLPVTIKNMFERGAGLSTEKIRLSYQNPIQENLAPDSLKIIDEIVREGIENKAFPGCQVLVAKNGTVVYHKTFGTFDYAGTHPVEKTDLYDLASITKAIATLPALMKLYDKKKIGLQDEIGKYISELKNTDKEKITVRSLLFHESRLPEFLPFYRSLIDSESYNGNLFSSRRNLTFNIVYDSDVYARSDFKFYPEKVSQTPKKGIEKRVADKLYIKTDFEKDVLLEIANTPLKKKNGYLYSDLNFMLLKEAIENISRQTLDNYLKEEFYHKLGANYTTFKPLEKFDKHNIAPTEHDRFWRNDILIGYPHDEAAAVMGGVSGNAGLFSNSNDIAKILQMLLWKGHYGGETFFSESTVRLFTETKSPNSRRGLGFDKPDMSKPDNTPASANTFGHTGYTGTCFWVDPNHQLIYIFLSNRVYPSRTYRKIVGLRIRERIHEAIYKAIDREYT